MQQASFIHGSGGNLPLISDLLADSSEVPPLASRMPPVSWLHGDRADCLQKGPL